MGIFTPTIGFMTLPYYMGVSKNNGTPKWMVYFMENPIKIDDLGVPLYLETPICSCPLYKHHKKRLMRPYNGAL